MPASPPNILLLFTDQHRADVLSCEGHPDVDTPNLDALAASGTRFTRAYCQNAICVPSRNSMISGLYPRTLGCLANDDHSPVMDEVVSLQACLRKQGYRTAAFGKRHLRGACDNGWDLARSHLPDESEPNYRTWIKEKGLSREFARDWAAEFGSHPPEGPGETHLFTSASMCAQVSELSAEHTMEAYTTQHAIDFLRESAAGRTPFFCWASLYRPHQPYTPVKEYYDRFDTSHWGRGARYGDGIAKPASFNQPSHELPPKLEYMRNGTNIPWQYVQSQRDPGIMRRAMAAYFACVLEIDNCIGRMLRELDTLGLRENTIVVYASDHGDFVGGHGLMEKVAPGHNVYEETLRVPWIFRWPGRVRAGHTSRDLVELVDLYPTLLDLCGLDAPDSPHPLQGTPWRRI